MIKNYNWYNFSDIEIYNGLLSLLSHSKKTKRFPVFSIENILNNEWLLLFLLNQKKFIETSNEKNAFWNIMYKLTKKWNIFLEKYFFSKKNYLFLIIINFIIFILPFFLFISVNILKEKINLIFNINLEVNSNLFFLILWLFFIIYVLNKNRKNRKKIYFKFKKKYNLI